MPFRILTLNAGGVSTRSGCAMRSRRVSRIAMCPHEPPGSGPRAWTDRHHECRTTTRCRSRNVGRIIMSCTDCISRTVWRKSSCSRGTCRATLRSSDRQIAEAAAKQG